MTLPFLQPRASNRGEIGAPRWSDMYPQDCAACMTPRSRNSSIVRTVRSLRRGDRVCTHRASTPDRGRRLERAPARYAAGAAAQTCFVVSSAEVAVRVLSCAGWIGRRMARQGQPGSRAHGARLVPMERQIEKRLGAGRLEHDMAVAATSTAGFTRRSVIGALQVGYSLFFCLPCPYPVHSRNGRRRCYPTVAALIPATPKSTI